jgi:ribose 5-phosphate isomerase B
MIKVAIGSDHAGFEMKEWIKSQFSDRVTFEDFGTHSLDSMDYPDVAHPLSNFVSDQHASFGILLCGSANGMAMTANKHASIRAAIAWTPEIASLARSHNNANIVCVPARFVTKELGFEIVEAFMNTSFEGGRHQNRIDKMPC